MLKNIDSLFDDLDNDDFNEDLENTSESDLSNDELLNSFNVENNDNGTEDPGKSVFKTAAVAIAFGIVLISAVMIVNHLHNKNQINITSNTSEISEQQEDSPVETESESSVVTDNGGTLENSNETTEYISNQSSGDWVKFSSSDIKYNENYIDTVFTITDLNNYVKIINDDSNLMVKTELSGIIDGFNGTYTLDIPYSKGCKLTIGDQFSISVQIGTTDSGSKVIDDIKY